MDDPLGPVQEGKTIVWMRRVGTKEMTMEFGAWEREHKAEAWSSTPRVEV